MWVWQLLKQKPAQQVSEHGAALGKAGSLSRQEREQQNHACPFFQEGTPGSRMSKGWRIVRFALETFLYKSGVGGGVHPSNTALLGQGS